MKIEISEKGVLVDGIKLKKVIKADVINLNPYGDTEVVLHIAADEIEVDHKPLGIRE